MLALASHKLPASRWVCNAMSMFAGTQSSDFDGSRVLQLLNMVTPEELIDNDDYEGIWRDGRVSYSY